MDMDISCTLDKTPSDHRRSVGMDGRVHFDAAACLPVRFPEQECGLCAPACPVGVIGWTTDGPDFRQGCIGCGQCAAVCPSGAPSVDGFVLPTELLSGQGAIHVDCWRVPFADSPKDALRVPCLAGIGTGWLLALFDLAAARGERTILLLERGICEKCTAGTGMPGLRATLREVREWLIECGVTDEWLPKFATLPVRGEPARDIPTSASETRIDRRRFFRGLLGGVVRGAEEIVATRTGDDAPITLRSNVAPLERMRIVTALAAIASRHGRTTPVGALPMISLAACGAHGICAKVCPTGALVREERDDAAELKFFSARCIACGQCARTCPDKALRVAATGGSAVVETLARWQAHECAACSETFFGTGETCPGCSKHQQLFQGMAALFRPSA